MADFDATLIDETLDVYYEAPRDLSLDSEADMIELPSGSGAAVVYYNMRAWNTNLLEFVYWRSSGTPDFTGASSGYPPGDLTLIVVQSAPRT